MTSAAAWRTPKARRSAGFTARLFSSNATAKPSRMRLRDFLLHEHPVAAAFGAPTSDGIKSRRAQRLAGFKAEARVMQRPSNPLADDQNVDLIWAAALIATGTLTLML
jgi:hypothetical protein